MYTTSRDKQLMKEPVTKLFLREQMLTEVVCV